MSNDKDEYYRCSTNLDLHHHPGKGGLQSPELPGGVLLDNHYLIVALLEDSDSLRSRFVTLDLLHLVLLHHS